MGKHIKLKPFEPYEKIKDFKLEDIPFYEPEKPPRHDLWHKLSYLDEEERMFGKKWGAQGIGQLREVLVCRPSDNEINPIFKKDRKYYMFYKGDGRIPDVKKMQEQHDELVEIYKREGIEINYMEYPENTMGPYGPMRWLTFSPREVLVVRGGAIIQRTGALPYAKGREIYLMKTLLELGCPILYTVHGNGIFEVGACPFLAEGVYLTATRSIAYNEEGLEQVKPILQRAGIKEIVVTIMPGPLYSVEFPAGGTCHPDGFLGVVDKGLVVIYPPFCGYDVIEWLRNHSFKMIEIPPEEQRKYGVSNVVLLRPGKVIMPKGATQTIREVEKAGVEVIQVDYSEVWTSGGGINCSTLALVRDPGPTLEEIIEG